ncbi:MAG: carboxyl transferase domain-containing protein [Actinomycetota bacterium]
MQRVLIANRGEIAIRIAKAATSLGIESVAVFADADADSLHPAFATTSRPLPHPPGATTPIAAYLDIDALLAIAADAGCDAVHPGYGFLAESSTFASRCIEAGLTFIGPDPEALALFGDKVTARNLAQTIGVPTVPGSERAITSVADAVDAAATVGYPVMLKAAAGGGGRGMRVVAGADEMAEQVERAASEAEAAFGDGSLFVERLVLDPRHIEVQVLADGHGSVVHLHERDCSVQQRNQKVVEIAPAPALDADVRESIHDHAVRLAEAGGIVNAATVEFLHMPETGETFFIECNPRIQVEHTVTEVVTGVDLVEAQFRIAAGASLSDLGLAAQASVPRPRGFAVQARVVATGAGVLSGYREPSGPGVRVDGAGYAGYEPSTQFDPLLAKVIGASNSSGTLPSALDRTARALQEFDLAGLPTNLGLLAALLSHPAVGAGDARTTLVGELVGAGAGERADASAGAPSTERVDGGASLVGPAGFLRDRRAAAAPASNGTAAGAPAGLAVPDGHCGVESPTTAVVMEIRVAVGDALAAGDPVMVLNAMKMETLVTAPQAGRVVDLASLAEGDQVAAGEVIAVLAELEGAVPASPEGTNGAATPADPADTWGPTLDEVAALQQLAHARFAPDSSDPGVVRQRSRNKLTCRERIDLLLDADSFREVGSLAGFASYDDEGNVAAFTPANHVGGTGEIESRAAVVCADDFTSRGGHADGAIGAKSFHLDLLSMELGVPSVRLLDGSSGGGSVAAMVPEQRKEGESTAQESSGAISAGKPRVAGGGGSFLPGHLGSTEYARQLAEVPVVNVLLGSVVGLGAAKAVLGHFSVMVRDIAQLFVAGPPVVSHAMGYDVTKEDLGDWRIHCRNGSVDNLADTEADAMAQTQRFLSYLPSNVYEAPPILAPRTDDPADRRDEELFTLIPRKRTTTFDMRRAIELIADRGSFFEIGPLWGTDQIVGFVRMNGHPMGVIASDSRHVNGGALTADGCDKLTRHLDLCDLFHLPILNLIDNPGFAVGIEHEQAGTIRKGGEWMVAFAQTTVPIFSVLMRRSFGVAGNNYATPRREPNVRVVWPAADVGGIPPEGGIEAAYKRQLANAEDPVAFRAELEARIEAARGPVGPLSRFQMEEMIDPRDTRRFVCEWAPTAYRRLSQPDRLGPRDLRFRP